MNDDRSALELPIGETFHLMRRIMQEHASLWRRHMPELTKPQYAVLRVIGERPGIEQIAVTSAAAITSATLVEVLGRLVGRGLVDRKTDPDDGRRRLLALTQQGAGLLRSAEPKADHIDQLLIGRLEPSAAAQLQGLLRQMAAPPASADPPAL